MINPQLDHGFSYYSFGRGKKILVIFPDIMGTYESWLPLLKRIQLQYRIIIPTYPAINNLDVMITTLHNFLKAHKIEHFSLIGASLGGLLAQKYVRTYPKEADKLLLIATGTSDWIFGIISLGLYIAGLLLPEQLIKYFVYLAALLSFALPNNKQTAWKKYVRKQIWQVDSKKNLLAWGKCVLQLCWKNKFTVAEMGNWNKSLYIVASDNDLVFNPITTNHLKNLYPQATFHVLPKANHLIWINRPKEVKKIIDSFLG